MKIEIEGYENMTAEEKLAALEGYNPEEHGYVSKSVLDKAASDAAKYKKDLRAEKEAAEATKTAQKSLEDRIAELENEKKQSAYAAELLGLGYSTENAKKAGMALVSGDIESFFSLQREVMEEIKKDADIAKLKNTPKPTTGQSSAGVDYNRLITEAQQRGDTTALAYYIRLQDQAAQKTQ